MARVKKPDISSISFFTEEMLRHSIDNLGDADAPTMQHVHQTLNSVAGHGCRKCAKKMIPTSHTKRLPRIHDKMLNRYKLEDMAIIYYDYEGGGAEDTFGFGKWQHVRSVVCFECLANLLTLREGHPACYAKFCRTNPDVLNVRL